MFVYATMIVMYFIIMIKVVWRILHNKNSNIVILQNQTPNTNLQKNHKYLTSSSIIRHIAVITIRVIRPSISAMMTMFMLVVFLMRMGMMMGYLWLGDDFVCRRLVFAMTFESYQG